MARTGDAERLLARILDGSAGAFALLHRPETAGPDTLELLTGEVTRAETLAELELQEPAGTGAHQELLALIPYRQLAERGFAAPDDGTPLLAMRVSEQASLPLRPALALLPDHPVKMTEEHFDVDDDAYAETVRRVVADEIGTGEGANFVMKRSFTALLPDFDSAAALSFFRRLVEREAGAYWTFLIHTGERTLVGATPNGTSASTTATR